MEFPPQNRIEFADRLAVIATMHRKELAISPSLETSLGLRVAVPQDFNVDFNSDLLGTFTRDVDRPGDQVQTARIKAEKILESIDADFAIASEGSFFSHPFLGIAYNREIVLLTDCDRSFRVYGEYLSPDTNFRHQVVSSYEEAYAFALVVGFPDHGIVVMPDAETTAKSAIHKGITSEARLREVVQELLQRSPQIHLETDLRAFHNPTRMGNITKATQDLVRKLQQLCPQCSFVNFDVVETRPGLPCHLCGLPTPVPRSQVLRCDRCQFQQENLFPQGSQKADPQYCSYCNP